MNRAKAIWSAGLLSTGVLAAGCAVDASDEVRSNERAAAVGQPVISYDPATSTYRFESGTLDPVGFPWSVEVNHEVRGTLQTLADVLEVKGVAPDAEISFRSQYAGKDTNPADTLKPGESVDVNVCSSWVPTFSYCCLYQQQCVTPLPGYGQPYCFDKCVWTCWNYICIS